MLWNISSQACAYAGNSHSIRKCGDPLKPLGAAGLMIAWFVMTLAIPANAQPTPTPAPDFHRVEFINQCSQPIWLAETNKIKDLLSPFPGGWESGLAQACTKSAQCPEAGSGSKCVDGACTCTNKLAPDAACGNGSDGYGYCQQNGLCATAVTMLLPPTFTSGRFWGRTGCTESGDTLTCATGNCGDDLADCYGYSGNNATLWEESLAPQNGVDNYDASLASGYNVPITVVPKEKGTSCPDAGCVSDLLKTCPPDLQYPGSGTTEGCTQANLFCLDNPENPICTAPNNQNFYNCNYAGQTDQLAENINLESSNAGTPVCFAASDCPVKNPPYVSITTNCDLDPTFSHATSWPAGAGICIGPKGVIQNGGCQADVDDGQPCNGGPSFTFPYPDYQCATVISPYNKGQHVGVCLPPANITASDGAAAYGSLIWNADNFTVAGSQPGGGCALNSDCLDPGSQYCLSTTVNKYPASGTVQAQSVAQCTAGSASPENGCECYNVKTCSADSDCTGGTKCLNINGECDDAQPCYCETSAVMTGVCGPPNVNWQAAIDAVPLATPTPKGTSNYLEVFRNACPRAYSYQFDDQASDFSCADSSKLIDYTVTFCGGAQPLK
jgi:hypothetical protein